MFIVLLDIQSTLLIIIMTSMCRYCVCKNIPSRLLDHQFCDYISYKLVGQPLLHFPVRILKLFLSLLPR